MFCAHFGALSRPCWPYRGQTKGKVERLIGVVKSTLAGRTFLDREHLEVELAAAIKRHNLSVHLTTKMTPTARLEIERPYLLALPEDLAVPELAFDHLTRLQDMGLSPFAVEKRPLSVYAEIAK